MVNASVAETDSHIASGQHGIAIERHAFHSACCLRQRDASDGGRIQSNHDPALSFCESSYCRGPEAERNQTVECGRCASPQKLTKDDTARLVTCDLLDFLSHPVTDSAEPLSSPDLF